MRPSQPIQWSSEYNDSELGLVYYNYRYYNPADGRWTGRDLLAEKRSPNRYRVADNDTLRNIDILGLYIYAGNTAVDGTLKGVLSGVLSLEEAAKLLGVSIATVVAMLEKVKGKRAQCRPCDPPVGTWMEKREDSHAHYGMCPHYHLFEVNQSYPAQGCKCFAPKKKTVDKSQGYLSYRKPTGGGLMFV